MSDGGHEITMEWNEMKNIPDIIKITPFHNPHVTVLYLVLFKSFR